MFFRLNEAIGAFVWGPPMLAVFLLTGLYLSIRSGFFQIRGVKAWLGGTVLSKPAPAEDGDGSVSQRGALFSALAACLGTGNIVGVATAIYSGGAGSIFWMWISAVLGMMTCCCENILGVRYRVRAADGSWLGGPMMYIERGLGMKGLAAVYAVLLIGASLGMGNMTQANSVACGLETFGVPKYICAAALAAVVLAAAWGGLRRISAISEKLIPVLSAVFILGCFAVIIANIRNFVPCVKLIVREAFTVRAVSGFGMAKAMRYGISRGVFSNEAGLGSSAIIHSSARCGNPAEQGMWGILEVFIDTVLMCTVTAAALLMSGVWQSDPSLNGVEFCSAAFSSVFGAAGGYFLSGCISLFALATLVAWSYYGSRGAAYLFGEKSVKIYNILYAAAAAAGCVLRLESVWSVSDTLNGLMAVPNLFALLLLSGEAIKLLKDGKKNYGIHSKGAGLSHRRDERAGG